MGVQVSVQLQPFNDHYMSSLGFEENLHLSEYAKSLVYFKLTLILTNQYPSMLSLGQSVTFLFP